MLLKKNVTKIKGTKNSIFAEEKKTHIKFRASTYIDAAPH